MGGKGPKERRIPAPSQPSNLGVLQETQVKVQIQLHEALTTAHGGDDDDAAFLALELLHGAHLERREAGPGTRGPRGEPEGQSLPRGGCDPRWVWGKSLGNCHRAVSPRRGQERGQEDALEAKT